MRNRQGVDPVLEGNLQPARYEWYVLPFSLWKSNMLSVKDSESLESGGSAREHQDGRLASSRCHEITHITALVNGLGYGTVSL